MATRDNSSDATTVSLVTGANRGIGRDVCRQLAERGHTVLLSARSWDAARSTARRLSDRDLTVHPIQLDVTDDNSVARAARDVTDRFGRLDVLVNNATITYDTWQRASNADLRVVQEAADTNVYGPWRTVLALLPLLRESAHGRIVNVSSEAGSLAGMGGGTPAYSISKAALNALTRMLAAELRGDGILVNAVCPGWVATDMGGPGVGRGSGRGVGGRAARRRPHRWLLPRRPPGALVNLGRAGGGTRLRTPLKTPVREPAVT